MESNSNDNNLEINVITLNNDDQPSECGYCKNEEGSYSFGTVINNYPVELYEKMMKDGWRRCGNYVYLPNIEKSCCKLYTCRLNIEDFKINKEQRKIMKRFRKYLSGEYELNKEKKKEEEKQKDDVEMKNVDELKEKIEGVLKEYLKQKKYIQIHDSIHNLYILETIYLRLLNHLNHFLIFLDLLFDQILF